MKKTEKKSGDWKQESYVDMEVWSPPEEFIKHGFMKSEWRNENFKLKLKQEIKLICIQVNK